MSTETFAIAGFRRTRALRRAGIAAAALAAGLFFTGPVAAHGPAGPGQGPGFGMGPGMMGPWGGQGMMGPGMMMGPWGGQGMMGPGMMMGPRGAPGPTAPWCDQGMMGPGMMMGPQGGQGFGGGPGMMGPQQGRQGMMGPQQGGPGMMGPQGRRGMMAPGPKTALPGKDLTVDDVRARLENWLRHMGNPRLEVGEVKELDEDTIVADIVTKEGKALVDRFRVDRHTGAMQRES